MTAPNIEARRALRRSATLTRRLARLRDQMTSTADERRALWATATDGGVTPKAIREACGVSEALVTKELRAARMVEPESVDA